MGADQLIAEIDSVERETLEALADLEDAEAVEALRVQALGRKAGRITEILRGLKDLGGDERPRVGEAANATKARLQEALDEAAERCKTRERAARQSRGRLDVSVPGRRVPVGSIHPLERARREIERIFVELGFAVADGPEIEDDWHNFEALNIPPDHPARDMQDTFYLEGGFLMRTHTSPVQVRVMEGGPPPVRVIVPGRVFRRDSDLTHSPMFHQVEGLAVDRGVTFAELKGVLTHFLQAFFGPGTRVRFRPSFFPFTEPSAEVDIGCVLCGGEGCRVCSHTGWLEILGSGMVDPAVFTAVNIDPEEWSGYAFGIGIERMAMLRYGIDDMRLFFENDLRFLSQF